MRGDNNRIGDFRFGDGDAVHVVIELEQLAGPFDERDVAYHRRIGRAAEREQSEGGEGPGGGADRHLIAS